MYKDEKCPICKSSLEHCVESGDIERDYYDEFEFQHFEVISQYDEYLRCENSNCHYTKTIKSESEKLNKEIKK